MVAAGGKVDICLVPEKVREGGFLKGSQVSRPSIHPSACTQAQGTRDSSLIMAYLASLAKKL